MRCPKPLLAFSNWLLAYQHFFTLREASLKAGKIKGLFIVISFLFSLFSFLFALPVNAQEQASPVARNVSVTAQVGPTEADYRLELTADHEGHVASDTTIRFEVTYGASVSAGWDVPTTIIANWNSDTAIDGTHLYEYVIGSATKTHGEESPIVDTLNRKITWNLASFYPGTLNKKLYFELRTKYHYQLPTSGLTVRLNMTNEYINFPTQSEQNTYFYRERPPGPTPTPLPPTGPVPTTAPANPLRIQDVAITGITATATSMKITTNVATKLSMTYGTKSDNLTKTVTSALLSRVHDVQIDSLLPQTAYYLQLTATDATNRTLTSEIFTFRTAEPSETPSLEKNVIVVTSGEIVLVSDAREISSPSPVVLITSNTNYQLTYRLKSNISIKNIEAVIRSKTLGINTYAQTKDPFVLVVPMVLKEPDVYVANLTTLDPGNYEVYTRITDTKGNIVEQKLADLRTMPQLSIFEDDGVTPVPDARVFLLYYDFKANTFLPLVKEVFGISKNPLYTDMNGQLNLILPQGRYNAEIQAFGFDKKTVEFVLGTKENEVFPKITLTKNEITLANTAEYYSTYLYDTYRNLPSMIQSISFSVKFFNVIASLIAAIFVALTFLLFALYTHIRLRDIPRYLGHHLHHMVGGGQNPYLVGTVTDESHAPLTQARIEVMDKATHNILSHAVTNKTGRFLIKNAFRRSDIELLVSKDGFEPASLPLKNDDAQPVHAILQKGELRHENAGDLIGHTAKLSSSLLFEFFLVSSFIIEFFFFQLYGFSRTMPFFFLSLVNLLLWTLFLRERFEIDLRHLKIKRAEEKI